MSDSDFDIEQIDKECVAAGVPKFSSLPKNQQEYYKNLRKSYDTIFNSKKPYEHLNVIDASIDEDGNLKVDNKIKKGKPLPQKINIDTDYYEIKRGLKSGLHPKFLSDDERSIMEKKEGVGWYDNWA